MYVYVCVCMDAGGLLAWVVPKPVRPANPGLKVNKSNTFFGVEISFTVNCCVV